MLSAANASLTDAFSRPSIRPREGGHPKSPKVTHGLWYFRVLEVPQKYHSPEGWKGVRFPCYAEREWGGTKLLRLWSGPLRDEGLDFFGSESSEAAGYLGGG